MINIRQELTANVAHYEKYIRTCQTIKRGEYGDYDGAEGELFFILEEHGVDTWEFDRQAAWFVALVWRQARCNYYEWESQFDA